MSRHFDPRHHSPQRMPMYLTDQQWAPPVNEREQKALSPLRPFRPATQLSQMDLDLTFGRGTYQNFHKPWNQHNRFLADVPLTTKNGYRDVERMAPPPFDPTGRYPPLGLRASSAPHFRTKLDTANVRAGSPYSRVGSPYLRYAAAYGKGEAESAAMLTDMMSTASATLLDNMTTPTGAPCFMVPAVVLADIDKGKPLAYGAEGTEGWKVARVQAYVVPPSGVGYGEGGKRPFHQDYRHYKYHGFAGMGAKTSWAHNPKHSRLYRESMYGDPDSTAGIGAPPHPPIQETVGGPRRPLTTVERQLVRQFREHSYNQEGTPSKVESRYMSYRTPGHQLNTYSSPSVQNMEIVDPYVEKVNILTRQTLSPGEMRTQHNSQHHARVVTYRQPAPGALTLTENPSPNHGSQSPFHQRYMHYKYNGFAGKGATSSWARNPKHALLYDH